MKKRSVLGFNNDSYARAWKEGCGRKVVEGISGYNCRTKGRMANRGTVHHPRIEFYDLERLPGSLTTSILFYELDLDRVARFSLGTTRKPGTIRLINYGRKCSKRCGLRIDGFNRSILLN